MRFLLVSTDSELIQAAKNAYGSHYELKVLDDWKSALDSTEGVDLMFVDLVATLRSPGRIAGYEEFAMAKLGHPEAKTVPLVVFSPPADYELDAMVGFPNLVFSMIQKPIPERIFRLATGWV